MRHGLAAFGITTAILVPAALHHLSAGSAQVARLVAPGARSLTLDGATIDVAVDRSIVDAGDKVHLTLTARGDRARATQVAVLLLESTGSGGGRVDTPPRPVARHTITFPAGAGATARSLDLTLRGRRGMEMEGMAPFGRYTLLVMRPRAAEALERLRKRAAREDNPMDDPDGRYGAWADTYYDLDRDRGDDEPGEGAAAEAPRVAAGALGAPGEAARLELQTRPADSNVSLRLPDTVTAGQPFQVTVTVENPGKQAVTGLAVRLGLPPLYGSDYLGLPEEAVTIAPAAIDLTLRPHQRAQATFTVTAARPGTLGLYAATSCDDVEDWTSCEPVLDGQLDATDVVAAEPTTPTPTVVTAPTTTTVAVAPVAK